MGSYILRLLHESQFHFNRLIAFYLRSLIFNIYSDLSCKIF